MLLLALIRGSTARAPLAWRSRAGPARARSPRRRMTAKALSSKLGLMTLPGCHRCREGDREWHFLSLRWHLLRLLERFLAY